jgi:hypothetical protein
MKAAATAAMIYEPTGQMMVWIAECDFKKSDADKERIFAFLINHKSFAHQILRLRYLLLSAAG